jgi:hypothetical protein
VITAVVGLYIIFADSKEPLYASPLPNAGGTKDNFSRDINQTFLEKTLKEKHIDFSSIIGQEDSYIITKKGGEQVVLSAKKDILGQISSLQYILSRLTMEGRQFSRLDLRFDKPIITFKE